MAQRSVFVNLVANTSSYIAGMGRAAGATGAFGGMVRSVISRLLGPAALIGALTRSAQASLAFEDTIKKLKTQIGLANDDIAQMRSAALALGGATTKGPQELAEATFFVASAGLRGAAAMDVLRRSAELSAIGLGETKVVADTLTSAVNAYGEENITAAQASDVLVSAVRLGKASAEELAGSLGRVLPIASAMGVEFDEVGGIVAAMTRTGTDAATATTQLRAIMVSLLQPTEQSKEAMAELGLSASDLRDTIQEDGLWAALNDIQQATGGSAEEMSKLFPNVRALAGAMDLLGPQLEENAALMAEMGESAGVAESAFAAHSLSTRAELDRLGAAFSRTMIQVGDSTTGPINVATRALVGALTTVGDALERSNDQQAFAQRVAADHAEAMGRLREMTEGVSGAQLQAVLDSDEYAAALRRAVDSGRSLTGVEGDLAREVRMRAFQTRDATKFDHERIAAQEEATRALVASLDPMRAQNAAAERWNGLAARYADAMGDASGAQDDFTESLGFTNEELDDMVRAIDAVRDSKRRLIDPVYDLFRAEDDLAESQAEVNRLMDEGEEESGELAAALVDLQRKHADYDHALETSGVFMDGYIESLNGMIEEGRFTEEQVQAIIDRLGEQGQEMELLDGKVVRTRHEHTVVTFQEYAPGMFAPQARATGGPISPGRPYLVGEHGPELVVPGRAGTVIPAHQTRAMMDGAAGSTIVIEEYHTHQHVDDMALVTMLEMRQEAGRL